MCKLYGFNFVNYIIIFNIFSGFWIMTTLGAQFIYREVFGMSPSDQSILVTIIYIP